MTDTTVEPSAVATDPLLSVEDLHVSFGRGNVTVQAVAGISFALRQGETLGLVGESGCGKSTTGRAIVQVEKATSGKIHFGDTELTALSRGDLRTLRTQVQMIFQDPISSLNPRRGDDIVSEPLDDLEDRHQGGAAQDGQRHARPGRHRPVRQRRPPSPRVLGRPVPAHQHRPRPGAQAQAARLRRDRLRPRRVGPGADPQPAEDLKQEYNLTILFIAHDLAVVKNVSDRVAVMYLGRLCEIAPSDLLYEAPAHHYTAALLASAVEPDPEAPRAVAALTGEPPSPINPPSGCRFRTRRPRAEARCAEEVPECASSRPATRWPATSRSGVEPRRSGADRVDGPASPRRLRPVPRPARRLAATGDADRAGVDAVTAVWSDPDVDWSAFDLVLASGAWDNIHHIDAFLSWADGVATAGGPVRNAPATLRWNIDKHYLRALERAGVPTVPRSGRTQRTEHDPTSLDLPAGDWW